MPTKLYKGVGTMRSRLRSTKTISIVLLIALNIIGITYAGWKSDINLISSISSGELDLIYEEADIDSVPNNGEFICATIKNVGDMPVKLQGDDVISNAEYTIKLPRFIDKNSMENVLVEVHVTENKVAEPVFDGTLYDLVAEDTTTSIPIDISHYDIRYVQCNLWNGY